MSDDGDDYTNPMGSDDEEDEYYEQHADDDDEEDEEDEEDVDEEEQDFIKNKIGGAPGDDDEEEDMDDDGEDDNDEYEKDSEDDEDSGDEFKFQKFNKSLDKNYILQHHSECIIQNYTEVEASSLVIRNKDNIIIDDLHKTTPILSKYEKSRILGVRALQINNGSKPFISIPSNIIDGYLIAQMELSEKKIPFIIRRPVGNGAEYWKISDLEDIIF